MIDIPYTGSGFTGFTGLFFQLPIPIRPRREPYVGESLSI